MLETLSLRHCATAVLAIDATAILGAWIFEYFGFAPCELCLKQRWAYYVAIPVGFVLAAVAPSSPGLARVGLQILGVLWLASMVFGIYHSGVEWKWWPGPDTCTGTGGLTGGLPDLTKPVVMCDQAAIRILGLSLAGWNAVISLAAAVLCFAGGRVHGSSSVSQ